MSLKATTATSFSAAYGDNAPTRRERGEDRSPRLDPVRRNAIARGMRFGHAAVAYTNCNKLARAPQKPSFDICA